MGVDNKNKKEKGVGCNRTAEKHSTLSVRQFILGHFQVIRANTLERVSGYLKNKILKLKSEEADSPLSCLFSAGVFRSVEFTNLEILCQDGIFPTREQYSTNCREGGNFCEPIDIVGKLERAESAYTSFIQMPSVFSLNDVRLYSEID